MSSVDFALKTQRKPIVLEFGSAYIKIGFAGEHCPRFILDNPVVDIYQPKKTDPSSSSHNQPSSSDSSSSSSASSASSASSVSKNSLTDNQTWIGNSSELFNQSIQKITTQQIFDRNLHSSQLAFILQPLEKFFDDLFYKYLLINSKDKKIVICEDHDAPDTFKQAVSFLLFTKYQIASILFVENHDAVLLSINSFVSSTDTSVIKPRSSSTSTSTPTSASASASTQVKTHTSSSRKSATSATHHLVSEHSSVLLVDIGHHKTSIMPIVHGIPITAAYTVTNLGGKFIETRLKACLRKQFPSIQFSLKGTQVNVNNNSDSNDSSLICSRKTLEDIKVRACSISPFTSTTSTTASKTTPTSTTSSSVLYSLSPSLAPLELNYTTRSAPFEPLFTNNVSPADDEIFTDYPECESETSIVTLVLEALLQVSSFP